MAASRILMLLAIAVGNVGGCGGSGPSARIAQAPNGAVPQPDGPAVPAERKIIYNSQIEVVVDDLTSAQKRLAELVKVVDEAGGYLARQETNGRNGYRRNSSWTIRVPLSKFDGFVTEVEGLGELVKHSREAQDVTDAYADLDARLRNKQASEVRLLSHLQKTGELKDTLEVERELSRVRGEVEQLQGQLNLLKNKTDLATVVVTLWERESFTPLTAPNFSTEVSRTLATSWHGLVICGKMFVLVVVALIPWLAPVAVVLVPLITFRRLRVHRRPL